MATAEAKPLPASARTVVVCCKIPTGLQLQLQRPVKRMTDSRDGPVAVTQYQKYGQVFFVHGPSYPVGTLPEGFPDKPRIEGGFAMTFGIPADFWDQWREQNKLSDFVRPKEGAEHGAIFAYADVKSAKAAAREQESQMSGLEPLSTAKDKDGRLTDPRLPKPMNKGLMKIATEPYPDAAA